MRRWAALLAGIVACGAGTTAMSADGHRSAGDLTPQSPCNGHLVLTAGEPVATWRLGAIHFLSAEVGVGVTAPQIPCAERRFPGGIDVASEPQPVLLTVSADGGRHWQTEGVALPGPFGGAVEQVAATSRRSVWVATGVGRLLASSDTGADWTVQPVPGPVGALTITRRTLWALGCPHTINIDCRPLLARRKLPHGRWLTLPLPKLVSTIGAELVAPTQRTVAVNTGASSPFPRLAFSSDGGRRWRVSDPSWMGRPCAGAGLTAAGPVSWWIICVGDGAAGSSTKALLRSTDGGATWKIASEVTSLTAPQSRHGLTRGAVLALASPSPRRLWLASVNGLEQSRDAGRSWSRVSGVNPQGGLTAFDVLSRTHAWLLTAGQGLWRTTDGRHWHTL